jgi:hypothetical protein
MAAEDSEGAEKMPQSERQLGSSSWDSPRDEMISGAREGGDRAHGEGVNTETRGHGGRRRRGGTAEDSEDAEEMMPADHQLGVGSWELGVGISARSERFVESVGLRLDRARTWELGVLSYAFAGS